MPIDDTGIQLLFRFIAAVYGHSALGIGPHWAFDRWGPAPARAHHSRQPARPLLNHSFVVATDGES